MLCSCGDPACGAVGKHPLTAHGLKDATSDSVQLAGWWRRWPQANIGLVTGELADVLDIDGPTGRAALRRYVAGHDLRLDGPVVRTGSGWHYYVAPTGSGNRAGLLEQVDWRGRGGYVVAPPSRHATGHHYRWLRSPTATLPRVPAPLRRLLDPARAHAPQPRSAPAARVQPTQVGHPYGQAALTQELAKVTHAPQGPPQPHPLLGRDPPLQPGRRRRPRPHRRGSRPARRRRGLPAAGRGANPDPPHADLRRTNGAGSPPRQPSFSAAAKPLCTIPNPDSADHRPRRP